MPSHSAACNRPTMWRLQDHPSNASAWAPSVRCQKSLADASRPKCLVLDFQDSLKWMLPTEHASMHSREALSETEHCRHKSCPSGQSQTDISKLQHTRKNSRKPAKSLDDGVQVQCLPVCKADTPQWTYRTVPKVSSSRSFANVPSWRRKPQPFTYHLCAEDLNKTAFAPNLPEGDRQVLKDEGTLPAESSAQGRYCVMCPVRRGSSKLLPCCLCEKWCHVSCSYQTHLTLCSVLEPRLELTPGTSSVTLVIGYWMRNQAHQDTKGTLEDSKSDALEFRPTINLFELWEEGAHMIRLVSGRTYCFPKSLVVQCVWLHSPKSLSLRDAVLDVAHHAGESTTWDRPLTSYWNLAPISLINQAVHRVPLWVIPWPSAGPWPYAHESGTIYPWQRAWLLLWELQLYARWWLMLKCRSRPWRRFWNSMDLEWIAQWNRHCTPTLRYTAVHTKELVWYQGLRKMTLKILELVEAREQTGTEIPLISVSIFSAPKNLWPKRNEIETRETAFAMQKRKLSCKKQGQGNRWDQYGDSSSAASPSAEEGGNETHNVSEKATKWGPWTPEMSSKQEQSAQPYRLHPANRGESGWAEWAREVRHSQPEYQDYKCSRWHASAGDARAWDKS